MPLAPVTSRSGPLLERDEQLAELETLLDEADAEHGGCALVVGPAGIGKTRLLAAAAEEARGRGFVVLEARSSEQECEHGFGLVRQLFEPIVYRRAAVDEPALFGGAAALASPLFGGERNASRPAVYPLLHGLYWLAANVAAERPVLLAVDDAQWADAESMSWLTYLARRLVGVRVALVVGSRVGEGEPPHWLLADGSPTVLEPPPLSAGAVATMVRNRLGDAGGPDLAAACHRVSGGNPFLVVELLESVIADERDSARAVEAIGAQAPASVAVQVAARLDRLGVEARALAAAAAVLGDGAAELRHAAALAGLDLGAASAACDRLVAAGMLEPGAPIRFVHSLIRQAVLAGVTAGDRARAHAQAARLLAAEDVELERVASHLLGAEPAGEAWAATMLGQAGALAAAQGAPQSACRYLLRATASVGPGATV